jgi:hypothetical protein
LEPEPLEILASLLFFAELLLKPLDRDVRVSEPAEEWIKVSDELVHTFRASENSVVLQTKLIFPPTPISTNLFQKSLTCKNEKTGGNVLVR